MSLVINGQKGAFIQPMEFGRAEQGDFVYLRWQGTRNEIRALVPNVIESGGLYSYRESFTGAADQLEARFATITGQAEVPNETWELTSAPAEKDLMNSIAVDALGLTDVQKNDLRQYIAQPDQYPSGYAAGSTPDLLFKLVRKGERTVEIFVPILRHSMSVSTQWAVDASQSNVERIISTASMYSIEGVPSSGIQFSLPNPSDPATAANSPAYHYGWYKNFPEIRRSAWNKVSLEQSWKFGLWPSLIYGAPL